MRKLLFAAVALAGLASCTSTKVSVVCAGKADNTVDCTIAEVSGSTKVKTCWDTAFKCENGTKPTINECDEVDNTKPTLKTIALTDFHEIDKCDKPVPGSLGVENVTVSKE
jgi:putative VirB-like lipoprotein